jgi:TRAP-type C4-dicarboxylate transport system permease small subunit
MLREFAPSVSVRGRHLKWKALDALEAALLVICSLLLVGFIISELADVVFRNLSHPWQDAQEWTLAFFIWGSFLGAAVAVRRDEHFRLAAIALSMKGWQRTAVETVNRSIVLAVAVCMAVFGYQNYLAGYHSFLMPSGTPMAVLFAAIPTSGLLISLFTIEQLVNGWRHGFAEAGTEAAAPVAIADLFGDTPGGVEASPSQGSSPGSSDE